MEKQILRISKADNVAVVVCQELLAGSHVEVDEVDLCALETIAFGHKIALCDLPTGAPIYKYGFQIGIASANIRKGEWVHSHNLSTALSGEEAYLYTPVANAVTAQTEGTFSGYLRKNGTVGIRNEVWILPMVSCVNHTGTLICDAYCQKHGKPVDIYALEQPYGCSQLGHDHVQTVRILQDIAAHPNVGGVLLLSLGCENNVIEEFIDGLPSYDRERVKCLTVQNSFDEIADGIALLEQLVSNAQQDRRTQQPLSKLHVGFKCGASDAFSGITANPLCGRVCEMLVQSGASTVLTEVPEMFGAETILMNRAKNETVFQKIVDLINYFKNYYLSYHQPIYENPSPGNKSGGITTLEEKSLGCIQKGGNCRVDDVVAYGDLVTGAGLTLLGSPGNDPVSITALASSGCQLILFTTGRGNPLGSLVPTIKIASNRTLAMRKTNWIDCSAGDLLDHGDLETMAEYLFQLVLCTANGTYKTKSEQAGYKEIGIFKDGVIL